MADASVLKARSTAVLLKFIAITLMVITVILDLVFGWVLYTNRACILPRRRKEYRTTALVLAIANCVIFAFGLVVLFTRLGNRTQASTAMVSTLLVCLLLLLAGNVSMLWIIYKKYDTNLPAGNVPLAASGLTLFSIAFIVIAMIYFGYVNRSLPSLSETMQAAMK